MGKAVRRRAEKLNLLDLPRTILYASARRARYMTVEILSTYVPDTAITIKKYLKSLDRYAEMGISRANRKKEVFILALKIGVFVEINCRMAGFNVHKGRNHMLRINIYSNEREYIVGIANAINDKFSAGVVSNTNWDKMEKVFEIDRERAITTWKALL